MRNPRLRRRSIRRFIPSHSNSECEVEIGYITIPERLKLRELTENIQIAKDKAWEFEKQIEKRILSDMGISKKESHYTEFVGGKAIVKYIVSKKKKKERKEKKVVDLFKAFKRTEIGKTKGAK